MEIKLFDSELVVMEILWKNGDTTAKKIAELANAQVGWIKTTTYTIIKKCLDKGAIKRLEPNFLCHALLTKKQVQQEKTLELIDKMYDGAADQLVASLLGDKTLTPQELDRLKQLVMQLK